MFLKDSIELSLASKFSLISPSFRPNMLMDDFIVWVADFGRMWTTGANTEFIN